MTFVSPSRRSEPYLNRRAAHASSSIQSGAGLSWNNANTEGNRGERLFATGKQVDGGIFLAGRLRHDLNAGIESPRR